MIKRIRREPLPPARFSLGKFGTPINMFAVAYVIVAAIASFFPAFNDPTATSMNWSVLMFGGVFLIAVLDYTIRGRKHYVSPVQHVHKM